MKVGEYVPANLALWESCFAMGMGDCTSGVISDRIGVNPSLRSRFSADWRYRFCTSDLISDNLEVA